MKKHVSLKRDALSALQQAAIPPRRLMLLFCAVSSGVALVSTFLNFVLQMQAGSISGGLSSMGTFALLQTIQSALSLSHTILLPFWQAGLTFVSILWIRRVTAGPTDLLQGFRRFGPILRLHLLQGLLIFLVCLLCLHISLSIFLITPFAAPMSDVLTPELADAILENPELVLSLLPMESLMSSMIAFLVIFLIFVVAGIVVVLYPLRLANYLLLDGQTNRAIEAMMVSFQLLRRNLKMLFRVDLSFWWYYVLEGLLLAVCYLDMAFQLLGVVLPIDPNLLFFLCYVFYLLGSVGLEVWAGPLLHTTYAAVYAHLLPPENPANT